MPEQLDDPVLIGFAATVLLISVATDLYLLARLDRGPLLKFEPRRLVPWNAVGAALAVLTVSVTLLVASIEKPADDSAARASKRGDVAQQKGSAEKKKRKAEDPAELELRLIGSMLPEMLLVGGMLFFVAVYFHADSRDFGLPASVSRVGRDIWIGVVAAAAALAPVHIIQAVFMHLMSGPEEMESGHPLIKMMMGETPNWALMVLASVAAVVIAPICEEITFRLLLQGWLERWEDEKVLAADPATSMEPQPVHSELVEQRHDETSRATGLSAVPTSGELLSGPAPVNEVAVSAASSSRPLIVEAPAHGVVGRRHGIVPILISSLLFGLAHFGYGPEPIPLFFLALVLGYVYQRTHRIVPCIVAHAVFNLFTMVVLWRMALHGGG